ncbi:flavin-containing monooxygenase FMO GS-OX-like 9 [Punica granatum]|uniref:Flavin-containing monooxygenase n=2 Tax=Punica granatum TaxID=22663 RepID=A0A218VZ06_PUNGR|nr:flavin-containing monooxygenase FMO GS-OX-like 9 [Punica granatum]OWM65251.1 hypothetical protein CDL15_Pgr008841 [Punica granatum]PKI47772.1 hypothetical protein CRG98_031905 [Punica granatum]
MVSEQNNSVGQSKNVCVIGAGPSGLVAARELRKEGHSVVVLEQNHDVGGQWLYEPNVEGEDPLGSWNSPNPDSHFLKVHSSIYASLRLTSPREIMGYSDFPFVVKRGRDARRFPGHHELYRYLKDFCDWFEIRPMIRFNTRVEYVGMLNYGGVGKDLRWVVRSCEKKSEKVIEEVFDAVVVATGHYSHPRKPSIKGMDAWKGKQMHSHVYRVPDPFRDEVVVVVGNSLSGQDISMELVNVAKEVYLSAKSTDNISQGLSKIICKHHNLHLRPQIESLREDGKVLFVDGSWVIADTILYCTGYSYSFPFLDTKGIVVIDDDRVGPLFEHTFPPSLAPSLSFVGIPRKLIGFPFFESQGKWIAQLLAGKKTLPTWNEMMQSIKEFYNSKDAAGVPKHNTHDLAFSAFEYCDKYGDYVEFPHLEEWRKSLCVSALVKAETDLEMYRESRDGDEELLRQAFQSPHFTQLGPLDPTLEAYGFNY